MVKCIFHNNLFANTSDRPAKYTANMYGWALGTGMMMHRRNASRLKCIKLGCAALCSMVPIDREMGAHRTWQSRHTSWNRHNSRKYLASGFVNNVCARVILSSFSCCGLCCVRQFTARRFIVVLHTGPECAHTLIYVFRQSTTTSLVVKWPPYAGNGLA